MFLIKCKETETFNSQTFQKYFFIEFPFKRKLITLRLLLNNMFFMPVVFKGIFVIFVYNYLLLK